MYTDEPTAKQEEQPAAGPMHFPCTDPTNPFQPPDPTRPERVLVPEIDLPPPDWSPTKPAPP